MRRGFDMALSCFGFEGTRQCALYVRNRVRPKGLFIAYLLENGGSPRPGGRQLTKAGGRFSAGVPDLDALVVGTPHERALAEERTQQIDRHFSSAVVQVERRVELHDVE